MSLAPKRQNGVRPGVFKRRSVLQGLAAIAITAPSAASCQAPEKRASVPDYRRPEDSDDTAAAVRALEAGGSAYFPAGKGSAPDGAYLLQGLPLRSMASIFGDGPASVLRTSNAEVQSAVSAMSSSPNRPLERIAIHDLRLEGRVTETGFREHWNLLSLSGVSGLRIDRVHFVGFAGDGLYLGAEKPWPTREPRIIRDVVVADCLFDGLTNDNRNGISVTGGTDITIDRCRFRRCTRPNMPGPIDFEPDDFAFYGLSRVKVMNCEFEDCGGNLGQIAFMIPPSVPVPRELVISGNQFRRYHGTGGDVALSIHRQPSAAMPSMDVLIEGNDGLDGYGGVQIFSAKGVTIRGNRWRNYSGRSFLGAPAPDAGVLDVLISDRFERCGLREGMALALYKGENIRVAGNVFIGAGNNGPGSAPIYIGTGRIRGLSLVDNDFRNNPAAWGVVTVERGADYLPGTTKLRGNLLPPGKKLPVL